MTRFKTVLVDYDDDLFTPPDWVPPALADAGIDWVVGQHRSPETALEAACQGQVVVVQSVQPLLTRDIIHELERLARSRTHGGEVGNG